jgi:hypothetical protein
MAREISHRALRTLVVAAVVEIALTLVVVAQRARDRVEAQVGVGVPPPPVVLPAPPLPGVPVPPARPGAPATLAPLVPLATASLQATPTLVPPLARATPSASPTPRIFACTCYGFASRPFWSGNVSATGYYAARAAAENACLTFQFSRSPATVNIPTPVFEFFPTPVPPIGNLQGVPGLPNLNVAPGGVSGFALLQSRRGQLFIPRCAQCACN